MGFSVRVPLPTTGLICTSDNETVRFTVTLTNVTKKNNVLPFNLMIFSITQKMLFNSEFCKAQDFMRFHGVEVWKIL